MNRDKKVIKKGKLVINVIKAFNMTENQYTNNLVFRGMRGNSITGIINIKKKIIQIMMIRNIIIYHEKIIKLISSNIAIIVKIIVKSDNSNNIISSRSNNKKIKLNLLICISLVHHQN